MNRKPALFEDEPGETAALVASLQQTVRRLEELTCGEVDAVADWKGSSFMLPRAQESHRNSEASKQTAILNALPAHIALLDPNGLIVSVNDGWRRFWGADRDGLPGFDVGRNYLDLCNQGRADTPSFVEVAEGVGSILAGKAKNFSLEFSTRSRWFLLTTTSLASDRPNGAVVMCLDVTAQKRDGRRFRGLLEAAPDAMVVVDHLGKLVLLNLQAEKEFGYRKDELLGQHVTSIIPDGFADRLVADELRTVEAARSQQIGTGLELMGRRRDGSAFPIEIMLSPLESDEGTLVTAAIRNITVRKAAEQSLAEAEAKYRGLLEAAPDAMVVVDQVGDIVLVNLQTEKQFGYQRDELLGRPVTTIIPGGFAERLISDQLRSAEEAYLQHIGSGIELAGCTKDGKTFPIEMMLSPLTGASGILVTAAIRNISARKLEGERVKRLKDEFVSTVSHELRTPLTSIAGALSLLIGEAGGKLPGSALRLLKIAHTNSQRLVRLINDILDIEKAESGKMPFVLKATDVRGLCEQVVESNLAQARSHFVSIKLIAPPGACILRVEPDRLVQILTNLISNAIKFSPSGSTVELILEDKQSFVCITVRDHGSGIAEDFKSRVFEKFAQADSSDARQKGGTGLGLSIVKELTTLLGGTVGFKLPPGGGTSFYIELPRRVEGRGKV